MPEPTTSLWWTVREFAEHYQLSERSVYDIIAAGWLVAHRFGQGRGAIRIADRDRLEWERQCREAKAGGPNKVAK